LWENEEFVVKGRFCGDLKILWENEEFVVKGRFCGV